MRRKDYRDITGYALLYQYPNMATSLLVRVQRSVLHAERSHRGYWSPEYHALRVPFAKGQESIELVQLYYQELLLRLDFHQKDKSVDTHMCIAVLAYHILHIIEYKLSMHTMITVSFREKTEGDEFRQRVIRTCTKPEAAHRRIYNMFGLKGTLSRVSCLSSYCSDHK